MQYRSFFCLSGIFCIWIFILVIYFGVFHERSISGMQLPSVHIMMHIAMPPQCILPWTLWRNREKIVDFVYWRVQAEICWWRFFMFALMTRAFSLEHLMCLVWHVHCSVPVWCEFDSVLCGWFIISALSFEKWLVYGIVVTDGGLVVRL